MIGRGPLRASHVLAIGVLCAGFVCAGSFTHPSTAAAASESVVTRHMVTFESNGTITQLATDANTVGDFLRERAIVVGPKDYLYPSADVPLSDGLVITYRAAVPVTIESAAQHVDAVSSAPDVGALLEEQNVRLGANDVVQPELSDRLPEDGIVRITRVVVWQRHERRAIAEPIEHRLDFAIAPGESKVVAKGSPGERNVTVRFTQRDNGKIVAAIVASHVIRKPRPRIVAEGVDEYQAFEQIGSRGLERTAYMAATAMQMIATAYTADCYGCSGITASGRPAGHGIVAVDPSVIPLGTRLYIPGYGFAVAGDTGGAIRGARIDLGFNSQRDAMLFGRREVTVYRLK
ncbi:MAG TPA: 3D domain-containing protein [Verrucomicrobiae bacterium]|nr:3D domain-containing protein [Verrucomicrobiae bacterium]